MTREMITTFRQRTGRMTHIAIQEALNGKVVEWMEKVSHEQYKRSLMVYS